MKAAIFFVSDDSETIAKVKTQFESESQFALRIFTTSQWDQLLEDSLARQTVHVGVPTLSAGLGHDTHAKVLHFAKSSGSGTVETMEQLEAKAIEAAIVQFKGNLTEAAKALGIGRATLYRKVKHFSIDPNQARRRKVA
jgi:transcriptional regulator of acetoin/glycerol metabolism